MLHKENHKQRQNFYAKNVWYKIVSAPKQWSDNLFIKIRLGKMWKINLFKYYNETNDTAFLINLEAKKYSSSSNIMKHFRVFGQVLENIVETIFFNFFFNTCHWTLIKTTVRNDASPHWRYSTSFFLRLAGSRYRGYSMTDIFLFQLNIKPAPSSLLCSVICVFFVLLLLTVMKI